MLKEAGKVRDYDLDLLRIFSCLCIIILHVSGHLLWTSRFNLLVQGVVRPCLWVFVALSGYYILNKPIKSFANFYLNEIPKLLFPLVIYSIIYQIYPPISNGESFAKIISAISIKNILAGDIVGHLWFVYGLFALYIIAPFLQILLRNLKNWQIALLLFIIFYYYRISPILSAVGIKINLGSFAFSDCMLFYFIFGYFLKHFKFNKYRIFVYIIGLLNIYFTATNFTNSILVTDLATLSLNMVIGVIFYFYVFKNLRFSFLNKIAPFIGYVSKRTFGIYLIHMFIFTYFTNHSIFILTTENRFYMLLMKSIIIFIIGLLMSSLIDLFINKVIFSIYKKLLDLITKLFKICISKLNVLTSKFYNEPIVENK